MPSLIDIRRRIRSVKNTQQITRAMKMVSSAKLRKASERAIAARPYAKMLDEILKDVSAAAASDERVRSHPLLAERPEEKVTLVLVTSDRGLAGAFNTNLIKAAQGFVGERPGKQVEFELVGKKGRDFFRRRKVSVTAELTGLAGTTGVREAVELADRLIQRFSDGETDAVYIIYNEFRSVLSQRLDIQKVLPLSLSGAESTREYIYEQEPAELLKTLLPRYIQMQVYRAFLETTAAEHAARMTAMDAATTNASDVIEKLTLYMNRVRQASITREIIEVVSGASALE
jgi:F-type H+-transporting ATPase subunit gamma